jgi:cell division protein FtsI (penicillin-binding protein 3)
MTIWKNESEKRRSYKIFALLFIIILLFFFIFMVIKSVIQDEKQIPSLVSSKVDLAVRGDIISADNFKIATSEKIFMAGLNTKSFDTNKIDLFINLFSIYSNMDKNEIKEKLEKSLQKPGYVVLSNKINSRDAKNLKLLSTKLLNLKVFKKIQVKGQSRLFGLDIKEIGENRLYPYKNTLTPLIGYVKAKNNTKGKVKEYGLKGLEKNFENSLSSVRNGILKGERDVSSKIIFNSDSIIQTRKDGDNINLTIPLRLQKNIELILDKHKKKLEARDIIASVMDSTTGEILTLASSNRFNPSRIKQDEISHLQVNAVEYPFEPGSVIKPISISLVLENNKIDLSELLSAHNKGPRNSKGEYKKGKIKIGRWKIGDDHQFKKNYLTIEDIIIHSSNIGTLLLANRLSGAEMVNGYKKFGLYDKTGIELEKSERVGYIPSLRKLSTNERNTNLSIYKSTVSYGQGMTSTFMQLMKAYSVFNNDGKIVTPFLTKKNFLSEPLQVISKKNATIMKNMLIKTVQKGTGQNAKYDGIEIGGKTGTANVARGGKYKNKYNSSFFGFANKNKKKYIIGVTVFEPIATGKKWYYHYASHSAAPVFKEIVEVLEKLKYFD